jgi:protein-arginine kinase activator protein McsA
MSHDIKKCLQCGTDYDAALSQPGNEQRRKFCCRECKTAYHNIKHYREHADEIKAAVIDRRGGKRDGAGRKPRTIPREAITVRLEREDATKLRELCQAQAVSQAEWIASKIRRTRL